MDLQVAEGNGGGEQTRGILQCTEQAHFIRNWRCWRFLLDAVILLLRASQDTSLGARLYVGVTSAQQSGQHEPCRERKPCRHCRRHEELHHLLLPSWGGIDSLHSAHNQLDWIKLNLIRFKSIRFNSPNALLDWVRSSTSVDFATAMDRRRTSRSEALSAYEFLHFEIAKGKGTYEVPKDFFGDLDLAAGANLRVVTHVAG